MKKLLALLMVVALTFQLVTPVFADTVGTEETTASTETVVEKVENPEEAEAGTDEVAAETTESVEETAGVESEPEAASEPTETAEEAGGEQVTAVIALIEALPSVEELEGMSEEEQLVAYGRIQTAFDAYCALSDEQKLLISGAEEAFEALFAYFNNQVEPMAVHKHPICGDADCTTHTQATFYSWDGVSGFNGSYIYLDQDAVRESSISIRGSVTICLNGHTISTNGVEPVFYVPSGSSLKICDCKGSGKLISDEGVYNGVGSSEIGIETDGGTVWVYSGTVEGNCAGISAIGGVVYTYGGQVNSRSGSGIYLDDTAKLTVKGGSITGAVGIRSNNATTSIIMSAGSASSVDSVGELSLSGGTVEGRAAANTIYLYDSPVVDRLYSSSAIMLKSKDDNTRTYTGDPFSIQVDSTNKKIVVDNLSDPELARQITLVSVDGSTDGYMIGRLEFTNQTLIQDIPVEKGLIGNVKWALYDNGDFFLEGNGILPDYEVQNNKGITPWSDYSSQIKKLYVGSGITRIGTNAFRNTGLEYVSFGTASLSLGDNCFYECRNLTQIDFGTGTIQPDEAVFAWCTSLENVIIPANVKMNGQYSDDGSGYQLFFRCGLTSATVECAYVGPFVFESCYSLNTVTFTDRNVKFYYVENDSGHPFNANGSGTIDVTVYGYLCSEVSALVAKSADRYGVKLAFASIEGDTTKHTEQIVPAVSPTCTVAGLTEGKVCSVCGTILQAQVKVDATGHTLEAVEAKESTCAEEGCAAHWVCTVCGATFSDAEGKTKTDPTIAKKAHTEVIDEAVSPTCTEIGLTEGKHCSVCNEVLVAQKEVPAIDHTVSAWTVTRQATCTEEGEEQGACSVCGNTATRAVPKIAHTEVVDERVEPTCTETGLTEGKHCSVCNEVLAGQKEIPALGHDMVKTEAVEPTYWETGNNEYYTCSRCGKVFKDEAGDTETTAEAEVLEKLPSIASGKSGNLNWVLTEDGILRISGNGAMPNYSTSSVAPWYSKRTKILSVVVEPGVTSVGNYAFYACLKLTDVELPEGVTYIRESAFRDCVKLKTVEIPKGVKNIGNYAFYGCSGLTSVTIPEGVTSIGNCAFYGCSGLTSMTIPESVTRIGQSAFQDCSSLTSVTIPEGLTSIGDSAFYGCSGLTGVTIPEGVTRIGQSAFQDCSSLTSVTIPEGVTSIGIYAFSGCSSLTSVAIPEGVTSIGNYAFYGCSGLTSVAIPGGVTSIDESAFSGCSGLTSVTISEGVTSIGRSSFSDCSSLTSVTIPEGVTSIGESAFYGCSGLTSVTIPEGVTSIGESAFYGCSGLTSVTIPEGVTSIEDDTFHGCSNLTSVTIPEGVTGIGRSAFSGCSSLASVTIPESVTSIGDGAFYGCGGLASVMIPESVTSIGASAFYDCSGLTSVTIPEGVTSIGWSAFSGCSSLTSVTIPESVTSIDSSAFRNCSSLTSVMIPEGVTSIGGYAFRGCSSLASISIPKGVSSIGEFTFCECRSLASISIPDSVTSIEADAFEFCSSLKDIYYGGDEVAWKQIEIGSWNEPLTRAYIHYGLAHICTTHLIPAVAPTCTTAGNNAYYLCDACGRVYKDEQNREQTTVKDETLPALGHAMTLTEAKAATCTEDGNNAYYTCGNCHKVFLDEQGEKETTIQAETLPALGHTIAIVNTKAPTCTEAGNKVYYICKTCGVAFKDKDGMQATTVAAETVSALGHTEVIDKRVEATCTESGLTEGKHCSVCDEILVAQEEIPAKGHTEVIDERVEPTCIKTGLTEGKHCSVCNEVLTAQEEIPANGHTEVIDQRIEPACTKTGLTEGKHCSVCGAVLEAQKVLEALGHDITDQTVNPTCIEQGYTIHTCAREGCEYSYTDSFQSAAGHAYGEWTTVKAPTCTEIGSQIRTCRNCDDTQTQFVPAAGHKTVADQRAEPTCTESGKTEGQHCSVCGRILIAQKEIPAIGHAEVIDKRVEPTCTETGLTEGKHCSVCSEVLVAQKEIPALGHMEVIDERIEPTCTETGLTEGKHCSVCNEVLTAQEEIPAKGHDVEKVEARDAACTEDGCNDYYVCRACGEVFKDEKGEQATTMEAETLPALGHEITRVEAVEPTWEATGNVEYFICSRCEKLFKDALGTEETTLEEVTLPMISYVTKIILTRDGDPVPETMEVDGQTSRTLSFTAMVQPDGAETNVEWSSSVLAVARVNQSGVVTMLTSGTTVITAAATDGSGVTAQVTLNVTAPDYAPRLGASTLTLNSVSCAGVSVDLVESYGNQILSVSVDDERFDAEYADNLLTLTSREAVARGVYRMTLEAACDDGRTYSYPITVRAIQTLPRLVVRQSQRFNLFYRDSQATLTITGGEVESAELTGNSDFVLENEDGEWVIRYADPENAPAKPNIRATLSVSFAGYNTPVTRALTIITVNTAPRLTLNPASSTLNTALNSDWSVETVLSGADGENLYAYTDTPGVDVELSGNALALTLTDAKNVSANVYVQDENWTKPVKLTHRITVTSKLPTLRAATSALKLNSWFPSETASTGMILSQGNVSLTDVELTPAAREGTAARVESDKLNVYYNADLGEIVAEIADPSIKNGTYSFTCTGILENGTEISGGTVRVTVSNTLPRARLSAAMVRLNRQLAGEESVAVKVTLTGGDGYAIEGFEELPDCLDYADGVLTATLPDADFTGGNYVLNAIVSRNGETATLPTGVSLRVQVYDRAPSFRLIAKGKLDVLDPASEIVYTPRLTNAQGTVTDIRLDGADAELFAAEATDGVVHLTMAKGCTYSTRMTYKVIPILTFCGQEVTGSALSIRVTQSVMRLAALPNRTVYQSQTVPLVQVLGITSPATAEFGEITLNSRSTAAFWNAVEAAGGIEVDGGIVRFPATAFASLKPGKYTVILDITPENAAIDVKPVQVRFTLTVQK